MIIKEKELLQSVADIEMIDSCNVENEKLFSMDLEEPNEVTAAAIEEGRRIASDSSVKGYSSLDDLKSALEI